MNLKKICRFFWKNIIVILIILLLFFFYKSSFNVYFSQDDFFRFKMGKASSIKEVFNFFSFKNQYYYGFYRPLTINLYSFIGQNIFGSNYIYYRIFNFVIFTAKLLIVYKIFLIITKNKSISFFSLIIYALSSFHLTTLSYLSAFEEIGVSFFYFLTIYLYLKKKKISILFFILALLSRETAITLPIILFLIELLIEKNKKIFSIFINILPFLFVFLLYLFLRWFYHLVPDNSVYQMTFSPKKIINNYFWYFFWGLNAPESLIDFIGPGIKINQRIFLYYPPLGYLVIIAPLLLLFFTAIESTVHFVKKKMSKEIMFYLLFFFITLSPFVVLLNHRFAFYLEIPFFGFCGFVGYLFRENKRKRIFYLIIFLVCSFITIIFYEKTYWAINRSKISYKIINEIKIKINKLPKAATLYFLNDKNYISPSEEWGNTSTQAKIALSGCLGPQFVFNDPSLSCFFEDDSTPPASSEYYPLIVKLD